MRDYHSSALGSGDRVDFWNGTGDGHTFTKMMPAAHFFREFQNLEMQRTSELSRMGFTFLNDRRKNDDIRQSR